MYISIKNCFTLDEIIKSFEVAYRSYITHTILSTHPTLSDFSIEVNKINDSIDSSSLILSHKYKSKISKIKNQVGSYYQKIQDCNSSYLSHDYGNDVPYVSEIIDYVLFFFNSSFQHLAHDFTSIEEFKDYSTKYTLIRNRLSHPASSKIQIQVAKEVIAFVRKICNTINGSFFWYVSKREIIKRIDGFVKHIDETPLRYHNLRDVRFTHNKIVCRERELKSLGELIFGKDENYRKSGSVIIFGYGGVGKTALALEFLYRTIKDIYDERILEPIEFILFYTAKEEVLSFSQTSGDLYINEIQKQISSLDEFQAKVLDSLDLDQIEDLNSKKGIIVIDNFETISEIEKSKILDFIKSTPRTIQYVLTSRNEEHCEDKLNLKEYRDLSDGERFIDEYVDANDFRLSLSKAAKKELLNLSKGNTLVLVLTIQLINYGIELNSILQDLRNVESRNVEVIADFMYKNTINNAIQDLQANNYDPVEILKIISLYEVPIDLYSISYLANQDLNSVEHVCKLLANRLVLEKQGEAYTPNEFANKFILSKYLPHNIEKKEIKQKIKHYRKNLDKKIKNLEAKKKSSSLLDGIMKDWKPKNSIDAIAIAEAFSLYNRSEKACDKKDTEDIKRIRAEFTRIEKMTSHPYIQFQKARCHELFLKVFPGQENQRKITDIISKSFEGAIEATDFYYPYIKSTKSYASLNWIYGIFLSNTLKDDEKALRYLEDAIEVFRKIEIRDKSYFTAINNLSHVYNRMYRKHKDRRYLDELRPLFFEIVNNRVQLSAIGFRFDLYMRNFSKHFPEKRKGQKRK